MTRYAVLIEDNDGNTVVSDIKQMEGTPTEPRSGNARFVKVADGVLIGMVKGGPVDAVGGYGFPEGTAGKSGRSQTGVTKTDPAPAVAKGTKASKADAQ
jgi:hypothetical protein